ncbi:MAG: glycyl-radical enzyme activating protein [Firmicutes bacterium]|nr:glycyl-radical enzyme activating protein [Bacillota bacterium]
MDDGPGIRTTVFFKGCNLRCAWCHNPECIIAEPTLQFTERSCVSCGRCEQICPAGVHHITEDGKHLIDRSKCIGCGKCAYNCYQSALDLNGKAYAPDELFAEIRKDRHYFESSGGGVTFSGGEPMLQRDYLNTMLKMCREAGYTTCVDTAGNVPFEWYREAMPWTTLFLYDIKLFDSARHEQATGVPNGRILENLRLLTDNGADVFIRTPVIPGWNDDLEEFRKIASFLAELPGREHVKLIQLLPYHAYGVGKYNMIGQRSKTEDVKPPTGEFMQQALQFYLDLGLPAQIS